MKVKLLPITAMALSTMAISQLTAQEYQPLLIQSGLNADVIANGVGPSASSTNNDVDGVNYAFISRDFQLTATSSPLTYGLPVNGIINSVVASTPGLSYQLASYSSNNSLRLQNTNDTGTLLFSNPLSANTVYMLATGGSGDCTVDVNVNFSDNTFQTFTGINISDWYYGSNFAIQGIGRINISNDDLESGYGSDPRLYQIPLTIDASNLSKTINGVTVTKSGTGGIPNIFAFAADAYNPCGSPNNVAASTTMDTATLSWGIPTNGAPSSGYQYYYSTSPAAPTSTTTPTGSVTSGTSVTLNSLTTGQTYYFWVRSNCGNSSYSFWKMKEFIPGQVSATYTLGDINTQFDELGVTPTSSTNCAGSLSINVPAGYSIQSTSVSYAMTAASSGWMSEQRSILVCSTNGNTEASISSGSGGTSGTYSYNRTGLTIANGLTGTVNFDLRAWRTYGGSDCSSTYNKVDDGTFTVTVTLQPVVLATNEASAKAKERIAYPNPFIDTLHIEKSENVKKAVVTDLSGIIVKTVDNPSSSLFLGELKAGMYMLTLTMKDGSVKSTKTIKR
ncbi:Por secretion system C-terminal sorting domain-containing protein [Chryseobacterium arachidis]|uniref:Por secretion system C-terminal sorting domain-containing protein n=1 Tax=Chryseobacterium arachidis TaxID=1416778 RepID=A0A1M4WUF3_9FLAO|nr:T9SS type A sorting domain-containing protein [Chryseobacterium arachidis]SHE84866.1 Por secretion system C-terminal sorting domain-containing protein [Chryseobacterium arachidis]